jgi:DNA-binding NtrC family response regulator
LNIIHQADPKVIIYDLGPPPVDRAIKLWGQVCHRDQGQHLYIITTPDAVAKLPVVPCLFKIIKIMGKPFNFKELEQTIQMALQKVVNARAGRDRTNGV